MKYPQKFFTLIELLVVIAIIAILDAMLLQHIPNFISAIADVVVLGVDRD